MDNSIFTPLYFANYFVDQIQDAKNKVVDTFVFDDKIKSSIKDFVEAQRTFTKQVNRSTDEITELTATTFKETLEKTVKSIKSL
jgi:hypothetical protein